VRWGRGSQKNSLQRNISVRGGIKLGMEKRTSQADCMETCEGPTTTLSAQSLGAGPLSNATDEGDWKEKKAVREAPAVKVYVGLGTKQVNFLIVLNFRTHISNPALPAMTTGKRVSPSLMGVHPTSVHLMGVYLLGVHLTGVCLMDVHLTGVHLTGVRLMGIRFMGMHLIDVHLTGMYLMGVDLIGVICIS
jgi:uncharacterized protein YjbI with pentapeptide repeats